MNWKNPLIKESYHLLCNTLSQYNIIDPMSVAEGAINTKTFKINEKTFTLEKTHNTIFLFFDLERFCMIETKFRYKGAFEEIKRAIKLRRTIVVGGENHQETRAFLHFLIHMPNMHARVIIDRESRKRYSFHPPTAHEMLMWAMNQGYVVVDELPILSPCDMKLYASILEGSPVLTTMWINDWHLRAFEEGSTTPSAFYRRCLREFAWNGLVPEPDEILFLHIKQCRDNDGVCLVRVLE